MDNKNMNIEKLKNHVSKNLINFKDVNKDLLHLFANMESDNYLCFDTESCKDYSDNTKERVWCWSLSNTINDIVIYGYSLDDFITFIKSLHQYKEFSFTKKSKTKNINIKMWVHNLGWDFEFIKYYIHNEGYIFTSKILFEDGSVEDEEIDCNSWTVVENNGQVYNATINIKMNDIVFGKKRFKSFIKLKMYDSYKLVPNKLDTIGKKIIKVDEMFYKLGDDFDYKSIRPYNYILNDIEKCYIYNDVYILKEFIKKYYIENGLVGFTASSIAFNNMLNYMFPTEKKKYEAFTQIYPVIKDKKIVEIIDNSYSGGYTYCNPVYKNKIVEGLGHSIDRNSSYPSAMMYNKLPFGQPKYFNGKYKHNKTYDIALQRVHFDGFKRKNGSPIGLIKIGSCDDYLQDIKKFGFKNNDYVSNNFDENGELLTCNYNLVLTIDELKMLESAYDFYTFRKIGDKILKGSKNLVKNIDYIDGCSFQSKIGHLGDFINDCVERKNKYKEEHNECGKMVAKTDMNSVYGKLGSGFERTIYNYVKDEKGFLKHQRKYITDNEYDYEELRKYYRAYASFTTSYGRIALISIILKIESEYGYDKFLYSDTDSIYCLLTVDEIKSIGVDLDNLRLGAWDIEMQFYKFKCLGAKKYILYGHEYNGDSDNKLYPHCAGLPKKSQQHLNFENFYLGAIFEKNQKRKVVGGYRLENTTFELKEFSFYR